MNNNKNKIYEMIIQLIETLQELKIKMTVHQTETSMEFNVKIEDTTRYKILYCRLKAHT